MWYCAFKPDGTLLDANQAMRLACHLNNDLQTTNFYTVLHPSNPAILAERISKLTPDQHEFEIVAQASSEKGLHIKWFFNGRFDGNQSLAEIIGIGTPIATLNSPLDFLWKLMEEFPNPAVLVDLNGIILAVNSAAVSWLGCAPESIAGLDLKNLIPSKINLAEFRTALINGLRGEKVTVFLEEEESKTEYNFFPVFDQTGKASHLIFFLNKNVRELNLKAQLEESQLRLELAIQGAQDGFWDWKNLSQDDQWWSPRMYYLLGYEDHEFEPTYSSFLEMIHPADRMRMIALMQEHFAQSSVFDITMRIHHKSGDYRWFRSRGGSIRDQNGLPIRMAGSLQDITRELRAIDELGRRNDEIRMLYEGARKLAESLKLSDIYSSLVGIIQKSMPCDRLLISSYDPKSEKLFCEFAIENGKEVSETQFPPIQLRENGNMIIKRVVDTNQPLMIDDFNDIALLENPEDQYPLLHQTRMESGLILPIILKNLVIGIIEVFSQQQHAYSIENLHFLENISTQIGIAITNATLYDQAQEEIAERLRIENELRGSEEKFRSVIEQATDGIVITDSQGKITNWNFAQEHITGIRAVEAIGQLIWDVVYESVRPLSNHQQLYQQLKDYYLNIFEGKHANPVVDSNEQEFLSKNGMLKRVEISTLRIGSSRSDYRIALIFHDITQISRRHQELEVIARVNKSLRKVMTTQEVLTVVLQEATDLLDAVGTAVVLYEAEQDRIWVELATGNWKEDTGKSVGVNFNISNQVISSGKMFYENDVQKNFDLAVHSFPSIHLINAVACYPLLVDERIEGVLWVGRKNPFDDMDLRILEVISDVAASALDRAKKAEGRLKQIQRMTSLRKIDRAISTGFDLTLNLDIFLREAHKQLGCDAAVILLYNAHMQHLEFTQGVGMNVNSLRGGYVRVGAGVTGKIVLDRKPVVIEDLSTSPVRYLFFSQPERSLADDNSFQSYAAAPLIVKGQIKGVLELYFANKIKPTADWLEFLEMLAGQAAIMIESSEMFLGLQKSTMDLQLAYQSTLEGWVKAIDMRDKETEGHTQRVTELTVRLARYIGMPEDQVIHVRRGSLLHDIGKMAVPDDILHKKGKLTEEEWQIMRQHPVYAHHWLQSVAYLKEALDIPYCHHERWNGNGYPRGLKGSQIPLSARLFAIVDVWDALRSDRPYRKAVSAEEALNYIQTEAGSHFDPEIVEKFIRFLEDQNIEAMYSGHDVV